MIRVSGYYVDYYEVIMAENKFGKGLRVGHLGLSTVKQFVPDGTR